MREVIVMILISMANVMSNIYLHDMVQPLGFFVYLL